MASWSLVSFAAVFWMSRNAPPKEGDFKKKFKEELFKYGQDIGMAFSPPVVGCLAKNGFQKGGHRHPRTPLATPLQYCRFCFVVGPVEKVRHWATTWQTWYILLFLFQKMFLCMLLLLVLFIIACPPVLGWPSMLLFREGLRFHCRHYSRITFLTDWFSKSQFSSSTLNVTAQTRAVVSLSSSLPFVGGMMILREIYLPFSLHASFAHFMG